MQVDSSSIIANDLLELSVPIAVADYDTEQDVRGNLNDALGYEARSSPVTRADRATLAALTPRSWPDQRIVPPALIRLRQQHDHTHATVVLGDVGFA